MKLKLEKNGVPAIRIICIKNVNPLEGGETVAFSAWLRVFDKRNFMISNHIDYVNSITSHEFYRIQDIEYLIESKRGQNLEVDSLSKYIDMVYDYLQKIEKYFTK